MEDIYDAGYVEKLFDEMAATYETVNNITSFGFSQRWRRQFVRNGAIRPGMVVVDLMCGMGECWAAVAERLNGQGRIVALDLSQGMLRGAELQRALFPDVDITIYWGNALASNLEDESADSLVAGFGVKTFSDSQKETLAQEIKRILKPGGTFSLVEVSVPKPWLLRVLYMFYLKRLIPVLGKILLGNPENYRMLGVYTEKFGNCRTMGDILTRQGFQVAYHEYFYGCATGLSGRKP